MKRFVALLSVFLWTGFASAAEIRELEVEEKDGRYYFDSDTHILASTEALFDLLIDYDEFHKVSSAFKESRYMDPAEDGTKQVYTKARGCILFFCKTIERVELLEYTPHTDIMATVVPEQSDFSYSVTRWRLEPDGDGTRLIYTIEMEPDFWIPPVIGPLLIKNTLRSKGQDALVRIERLAREREKQGNEAISTTDASGA